MITTRPNASPSIPAASTAASPAASRQIPLVEIDAARPVTPAFVAPTPTPATELASAAAATPLVKEPASTVQKKGAGRGRKLVMLGVLVAGLGAGAFAGIRWYLDSLAYVSTDDAFIDGHMERVAPQIAGRVLRVAVKDNQQVNAGDVLVEIDPADYKAAEAAARAELASASAQIGQAAAQRSLAEAQVASAEADQHVADAQVEQARASLVSASAVAENARTQVGRYEELNTAQPGAISRQQLDDVRTEASTKTAAMSEAQSRLDVATAQRVRAGASVQQAKASIAAAQATAATATAAVQQATAKLDRALLDLKYTTVTAATSGRITKRTVDAGNYVQPGQSLLAIVGDDLYVTANLKETQLKGVESGRRVHLYVDALGCTIEGHVDSVMAGTGAAFSMLPPENATGNFVKVVQRVPVKIRLDLQPQDVKALSIGMSVEPHISLHADAAE